MAAPNLAHGPSNVAINTLVTFPPAGGGPVGPLHVVGAAKRRKLTELSATATDHERGEAAMFEFQVTQHAVAGECFLFNAHFISF